MIHDNGIDKRELYEWCKVPARELEGHPELRVPFRLVETSEDMGIQMAEDLIEVIEAAARESRECRAIIPCGPNAWYKPFTERINSRRIPLHHLVAFHMDEMFDWQGDPLPSRHPYNFRGFMERNFYAPIAEELRTPEENRHWPQIDNIARLRTEIAEGPIDITMGGWGQDGHVAYNQARRHPYSQVSLDEVRASTVRVQENNSDTILALAQRMFGAAYQFVPPMSVTLGVKECLSARRVRVYSDTGSWKQTALRVVLFSEPTPEYPFTLLQEHPDALVTATRVTASHPISLNPDWDLGF